MSGIVTPVLPPTDKTSKWIPRVGKSSKALINSLSEDEFSSKAKENLLNETYRILSSCHNPKETNEVSTTGLVVGRVQSGKTTSFKALTMMGMDNGFNLFILLAGRTKNLINQNIDEFESLQDITNIDEFSVCYVDKPKEWREVIPAYSRRINAIGPIKGVPLVLITNKHAGHIKSITKELIKLREDLGSINTLIIDDEADNASLNTAKDKDDEFSATAIYKSIKNLRGSLSRHTVTQYTATPQALLFISKKDHYSPEWARVISPGDKYVGAKDLFFDRSPFYQEVPFDEISTARNIRQLTIPNSFKSALRTYLLSSAQRQVSPKKFHKKNSTFMVHPDVFNITHEHWENIIREEISLWRQSIDDNLSKFLEDNKKDFRQEYKKLEAACKKTKTKLSNFDKLYENFIPQIIKELKIMQVNGEFNNINWKIPHNIIIGGYMLDRGYVVKGLVTTYMPRSKGVGMIDSLQQRGRFYGYKRDHLGFIRTWMSRPTINAYKSYAKHEAHLYSTLDKLSKKGTDLRTWERLILLDKGLKPCRKNVMGIGLKNNYTWGGGWYFPAYPVSGSDRNKQLFEFIIKQYEEKFSSYEQEYYDSNSWTDARSSLCVENINLSNLLESLRYYDPGELDEGKFATAKMILGQLVDANFKASIILTGTREPSLNKYTKRERPTMTLPMTGQSYFQGTQAMGTYPGERNLVSKNDKTVTFHLSKLFLLNKNSPSYILAIKFPNENYLVEEEIT